MLNVSTAEGILISSSVKYRPLSMASMVGSGRNWHAVEGIGEFDRLAYVVLFYTQPARNLRNWQFHLFFDILIKY